MSSPRAPVPSSRSARTRRADESRVAAFLRSRRTSEGVEGPSPSQDQDNRWPRNVSRMVDRSANPDTRRLLRVARIRPARRNGGLRAAPGACREEVRDVRRPWPGTDGSKRSKREWRVAFYSIIVSVPVAISAAAQMTSRFIHARRSMPTPSFSNTSTATNAVTAR
jgi:hypothetical protein